MNIAYLGWGSLIWDKRNLPINGEWMRGGPVLPIEFSRVSKDERLTLVIDDVSGVPIETFYAICSEENLIDAIEKLRVREGGTKKAYIGHVNISNGSDSLTDYPNQLPVHKSVADWGISHGFDAVIWTALPSNFYDSTNLPFSTDNALIYLQKLADGPLDLAIEYILKTRTEVQTPFRKKFDATWRGKINSRKREE